MVKKILTGITTTGTPHLGNYVGAIRPTIILSQDIENISYVFLANYHGLIKCHDANLIYKSTIEVAATWLACGLDPEKVIFYRQSDIPSVVELSWILSCCCAKGLMNRAHAYKAKIQNNIENNNKDLDFGIEMGLFCYPILMSADILAFNANLVPVGKDQIQHIEMARDIANRFNHRYKKVFNLPTALIDEKIPTLLGKDGRKMSKSYSNTIPLFENEKSLYKSIMKIVTNSQGPLEPKDMQNSILFDIYKAFATDDEIDQLAQDYKNGISWGQVKNILFNKINNELESKRLVYNNLINKVSYIEDVLQFGASKARQESKKLLLIIKEAVGIKSLK